MIKISCEKVQAELKAYVDCMLSPIAAFHVRRHLAKCVICRTELAQVERIGKELQSMATDISAEGDKLDPILRARILAAIPSEPMAAAADYRFRAWPVLGAVAAAVIAGFIILPHQQFSMQHRKASAAASATSNTHQQVDRQMKSRAAVSPANPVNQDYDEIQPSSSQPAAAAPAEKSEAGDRAVAGNAVAGEHSAARAKAPSSSEGMSASDSATYQSSIGRMDLETNKTPASEGVPRQIYALLSAPDAVHEVYLFTTRNLTEGTKLVRQTVESFQGSVDRLAHTIDANTIELTVNIPTSRSGAMLAAIPGMSGGALRAQKPQANLPTSSSRKDRPKAGLTEEHKDLYRGRTAVDGQPRTPTMGKASGKQQTPKHINGGLTSGSAPAVLHKPSGSHGFARTSPSNTITITIILVKAK